MAWLFIILANSLVQIPNILAIHYFGSTMSIKEALKLAAITMPIGFLASTCFTLYFAKSSELFSYPIMNLISIGTNVTIGFIVGLFILKSNQGHLMDYIGMFLIVTGIIMIIYKHQLLAFVGIV